MIWRTLAMALVGLGLASLPSLQGGAAGGARAASFNCAAATLPTDLAICGNPTLSALDSQIGAAYDERLLIDASVKPVQRGWLRNREAACGRDVGCLQRFMTFQLTFLHSGRPMTGALPAQVGACSVTRASRVGYRLGDRSSGSAIAEANGAEQVWYDDVAGVDATRVGDPMLVCLASLPTGCPPGDDRGKGYAAANLRTLAWWTGPDAEHGCGGA